MNGSGGFDLMMSIHSTVVVVGRSIRRHRTSHNTTTSSTTIPGERRRRLSWSRTHLYRTRTHLHWSGTHLRPSIWKSISIRIRHTIGNTIALMSIPIGSSPSVDLRMLLRVVSGIRSSIFLSLLLLRFNISRFRRGNDGTNLMVMIITIIIHMVKSCIAGGR